ncbi:MAG: thioredoxin domain-containing protein [Woeseiaceae bacterium]|nr:thioredoxin domain-containing protein [Woeseiaceae bacterium]
MSKAKRKAAAIEQREQTRKRFVAFGLAALVLVGVVVAVINMGKQAAPEATGPDPRAAALASEHAATIGDPGAKVHIVEFLDPACGTCAVFYPMVKGWLREAPDKLRLTVRHVPFHTGVDYVVQIIEASREQGKYWETLEALLMSQREWVTNHVVQQDRVLPAIAGVGLDMERLMADMNSPAVLARIQKDQEDAITLKVSATPEYFVNGRPLPSFGQQQLLDLVREELDKAY